MDSRLHNGAKKILSVMITLFMVMTGFVNPVEVSAATSEVYSFKQLQSAIDGAADGDVIVVAGNFACEETITIRNKVTIKGKDDGSYTIFQEENKDSYDTMFEVVSGGNLTLGGHLTLSGTFRECDTVEEGHDVANTDFDLDHFKVPGSAPIVGYLAVNQVGYSNYVVVKATSSEAANFQGNYISVEGDKIVLQKPNENKKTLDGFGSTNFGFKDSTDTPIIVGTDGQLTQGGQYIKSNGSTLEKSTEGPGIYVNTSSSPVGFSTAPATPTWEIDGFTYTDADAAEAARIEYNNSHWIANGDTSVIYDDNHYQEAYDNGLYYYVSSSPNDHYSTREEAQEHCGCSVDEECITYDKDKFSSGTTDKPKGFFVHVEKGGVATLNGATLINFNTSSEKDKTPKHVAPVVADGGTFNIVSGKISNNIVGYIANDSLSDRSADVIKKYVKGAYPNSPRVTDGDKRRRVKAGIDNNDPGSGITGTAGAVIYINGADGEISGGFISYNRGDTGGIMVSGENTNVEIKGDAMIDHNVGVQFGGGSFVEDGGFLLMSNGTMSENVAWFGGGAVFATENGIKWLLGEITDLSGRKDGKFTLNGGTLDGNTAFTRGGAILADSDGVALIDGKITNNKSRMLGGAVYVMGDDPNFTYIVFIEKGFVHDNKAVSATLDNVPATSLSDNQNKEENMAVSKILKAADPCNPSEGLWLKDMTVNSDDLVDGKSGKNDGTGGGIWLCAFGNTNLNLLGHNFVVDANYASGSVTGNVNGSKNNKQDSTSSGLSGGNDMHKDTRSGGNVLFIGATSDDQWFDENTGETYEHLNDMQKDFDLRNLVNFGTVVPEGYGPDWKGVDISDNISRRGGGLAADGTYVFGTASDIAELHAEMKLTKEWNPKITPEEIAVRVYVEDNNGTRYFVQDVPLAEKAREASELDSVFVEDDYVSRFVLPIFAYDEQGNKIQVFDIKIGNKVYDPTSTEDLQDLAEKIDAGASVTLDYSRVKFVFEEGKIVDGEFQVCDDYNFIADEIVIEETKADIHEHTLQISKGVEKKVLTVSNSAIYLSNSILNDFEPGIEKYVNEAVHKDILVDEIFTYDVLAYISLNADAFTITDTLVDYLEFVGAAKLYDMGTENNHKPYHDADGTIENNDATVHKAGTDITDLATISPFEQTLTVEMDDNEYVENLRGHWVKLTFDAMIKQEYRDRINAGEKAKDVLKDFAVIKENAPVVSDEEHDGVPNEASYEIKVKNVSKYNEISNTVTVKPEQPEIEKYVNKAVHKDIMLDEIFTYDIIGFISMDADKVIFTDNLVSDLELVNVADIKVESLTGNNHLPLNDIEGSLAHSHASVAHQGENIKNKDGVTITAQEKGSSLTVTIDENETVKDLRGKFVRITFQAQIKKTLQDQIKNGEKTLDDLINVSIDDNENVLTEEEHDGIDNTASYKIFVDNEGKYEEISNTVTVKPELPEIEKYVNQAVHDDIDVDEVFTYDVIAYITNNADRFTIYDELVSDLEFKSTKNDVKVYDLGIENNHNVVNDVAGEPTEFADTATVASSGTEIKENVTINISGNKLEVSMDDGITVEEGVINRAREDVKNLRGHWVKVTFKAQIKSTLQQRIKDGELAKDVLTYVTINDSETEDRAVPNVGNDPVVSDEDHEGVKNNSNYKIGIFNNGAYDDSFTDTSNTVTVKPEEFDDIPVNKTWVDEDDNDRIRPDKITVILKANGDEIQRVDIEEVDEEWTYTFEKLPRLDEDGERIEYTIEELEVEGYETEIDGFEITNTHEIEKTEVSGEKTWDDDGDKAQIRPDKITVILLGDGDEVDRIDVTPDDDGNWSYKFTDLPKLKDGEEIEYTVDEVEVENYETFIYDYDITNQHVPEEEPKKSINGKEKINLTSRNQVLTYTVSTRVPTKTKKLTIVDNLPEELEVVSTSFTVEDIEVQVNGQLVKVEITDEALLKTLAGKVLTLTIETKIKSSVSDAELIKKYGKEIDNEATVTINNNARVTRRVSFVPRIRRRKPDIPLTGIDD